MTKYVIKRILLALMTCFIVLSLSYILICCLKFQPLILPENQAGQEYAYYMNQVNKGFLNFNKTMPNDELGTFVDKVTVAQGTFYFYARPALERYWSWFSSIITRWDWGTSQFYEIGRGCFDILVSRLPVTISINIISVLISVPLGIGFGVILALKKGSVFDNVSQVIIMILISIPGFVVISYLILLAYNVEWLPASWPQSTDPTPRKVAAYIIPTICLSYGSIVGYARFVRAELCEVLESEYLLLARTKGLTRRQAILRHAFRNSMVPVLPSVVSEFISILGGSMILENLYQIPGIGTLYLAAFNAKDYSLLMTDMAFYTIIGLLASIVVDLSYGFIDPRIRMGAKK